MASCGSVPNGHEQTDSLILIILASLKASPPKASSARRPSRTCLLPDPLDERCNTENGNCNSNPAQQSRVHRRIYALQARGDRLAYVAWCGGKQTRMELSTC